MGFNWVTFIAQIVNLFVLVYLLKRFLYHPVIETISKRQKYIENKVKQAELSEQNAKKEQSLLEKKQAEFDAERQNRMDQAISEINQIKKENETILATELTQMRSKMQENLDRETKSLELEIRDLMIHNFMDLIRKTMTELSGLSPIEQALKLFQKKLGKLSSKEKENIKTMILKNTSIRILTSNALSSDQKKDLLSFIKETIKIDVKPSCFHFEVNDDLILGIEMITGDLAVEWNLKSYLDTFNENLNAALSGLIIKKQRD